MWEWEVGVGEQTDLEVGVGEQTDLEVGVGEQTDLEVGVGEHRYRHAGPVHYWSIIVGGCHRLNKKDRPLPS